ncbi:hypothetical protein EDB89DRAFT_1907225 [Lactarius sanguifluus]|nr:hypothetical protein EDB89DRAFT_1907225 [Lactarius sanguifluus]
MPPAASLPAAAAIAYWCRYRVTAVSWVDMAMVVVVVVVGVVVVVTVPCCRGCVVTSWLTRVHPSLMGPVGFVVVGWLATRWWGLLPQPLSLSGVRQGRGHGLMRSGLGLKVASPHWVKARAPIPPVKDGDDDDAGRAPDNNNNGRADDDDDGRRQQHASTRYRENNDRQRR